jgi:hypothetical protein
MAPGLLRRLRLLAMTPSTRYDSKPGNALLAVRRFISVPAGNLRRWPVTRLPISTPKATISLEASPHTRD